MLIFKMYTTFVQVTICRMSTNMVAVLYCKNPPSAFTLKVMSNGPLQLRIWNIPLRQNINIAKNSARNLFYKSTTTNMATVWNYEVKPNKFNIFRICTLAI